MFLRTIKAQGWPERLKAIEVGKVVQVAIEDLSAARQAISRGIPYSGIEMKFETKTLKKVVKKKIIKYGEIKRTA